MLIIQLNCVHKVSLIQFFCKFKLQTINMKHTLILMLCIISLFSSAQKKKIEPAVPAKPSPDSIFSNLKWRNIGPFRGGRANAVSGVVGNEQKFYAGYTGGGVWTTEDGGINWKNISDGFFTVGSIGEIAVSESDPNVVYVGMGEHAPRGVMTTYGDGVYKSTDGQIIHAGRYSGKKPKQAACKALTGIVKNNSLETGEKVTFLIQECTRGSKKKKYSYTGSQVDLEEPVRITITKKDGTSSQIEYTKNNEVKKISLSECGDLMNVDLAEDQEEEVKLQRAEKKTKAPKTKAPKGAKVTKTVTKVTKVAKGTTKAAEPVAAPPAKTPKSKKA